MLTQSPSHRRNPIPWFLLLAVLLVPLTSGVARADGRRNLEIVVEDLHATAGAVTLGLEREALARTAEYALWFSALPVPGGDGSDPAGNDVDEDAGALYAAREDWEARMRSRARSLIDSNGTREGQTTLREQAFVGSLGQAEAQGLGFARMEQPMGSELIENLEVHAYLLRRRVFDVPIAIQFLFEPHLNGMSHLLSLRARLDPIERPERPEGTDAHAWAEAWKPARAAAQTSAEATLAAMKDVIKLTPADLDAIHAAAGGRVVIDKQLSYPCGGETVVVSIRLGAHDKEPDPEALEALREASADLEAGLDPRPGNSEEARFTARRQRHVQALLRQARLMLDWLEREYEDLSTKAQGLGDGTGVPVGFVITLRGAREQIETLRRYIMQGESVWSDPAAFRALAATRHPHLKFATPQIERGTRSDLNAGVLNAMRRLWGVRVDIRRMQLGRSRVPLTDALQANERKYIEGVYAVQKKAPNLIQELWHAHSQREALLLADPVLRRRVNALLEALRSESENYGRVHAAWARLILTGLITAEDRRWLSDHEVRLHEKHLGARRTYLRNAQWDLMHTWLAQEPTQDASRRADILEVWVPTYFPPNAERIRMPGDGDSHPVALAVPGHRDLTADEQALREELLAR